MIPLMVLQITEVAQHFGKVALLLQSTRREIFI
jgi:hypothetical protein